MMLMRTDPFPEPDRLTQQVLRTPARPTTMPRDAFLEGDTFVVELDMPGVDPEPVDLDVLDTRAERWTTAKVRLPVMPQTPPLTTAIKQRADGHLKIEVAGEIDILSAPQLRATLDEALSDGARVVEVDFSGVEFCDCYGLGVLLGARRRATEQGTDLRLVSVTSPLVRGLLSRTGTAAALLGRTGEVSSQKVP